MKRRTQILALGTVIVLAFVLVWFWARHTEDPHLRLKVVRQVVKEGKPIAFFVIEGGGPRSILATEAVRIVGGSEQPAEWASQTHLFDPRFGTTEFGFVAPECSSMKENSGWRLLMTVSLEEGPWAKIKRIVGFVRRYQRSYFSRSTLEVVRFQWSQHRFVGGQQLLSDWITNSIPYSDPADGPTLAPILPVPLVGSTNR